MRRARHRPRGRLLTEEGAGCLTSIGVSLVLWAIVVRVLFVLIHILRS